MEEYLGTLQVLHIKQEEFQSDLQQTKRHLFEKIQKSYHIMQDQMVALLQEHTQRVLETVSGTIAETEGKLKDSLDTTKHIIQDLKLEADTLKKELRLHNEEANKREDSRKTSRYDKKKQELQEGLETLKRKQKLDEHSGAFSVESLQHKSSILVEGDEGIPSSKKYKPNSLNHLIKQQSNYSIRSPFDLNKCEIGGVCCLDDGHILLADANNKCLKILDKDFGLLRSTLSNWKVDKPTGISHLNDDNFVMSDSGRLKYFSIDSTGNTCMYKTLSTGVENWSVVSHQTYIFVLCKNKHLPYYNMRSYGYNGTHYGCTEMKGQFMCFNSNGSKLYVTDGIDQSAERNIVKVFDRNTFRTNEFEKDFDFSSPDLNTPCGVVTDIYDQVYICGFGSKNIIKFDKYGNQVGVLLAEENALIGQKILGYDKTNHRLIVAGNSDEIKVLDLK